MTQSIELKNKLIWTVTALVLGAVFWWHAAVLAPLLLSLVLAYALRPAVDGLVQRKIPRSAAVVLCLAALSMVAATVLILLVPIMSQLGPQLRSQLPDLVVGVWQSVSPMLAQWGWHVPTSAEAIKSELVRLIQTYYPQWGGALLRSVLIGGSGLLTALGYLVLVPVLTFYSLLDWDRLRAKWLTLIPPRWHRPLLAVADECDSLMGQYLRGQMLVMAILAAYYSVGLALFGFHLALPIGVFTGLAVFVPYLGYGLGLVLAIMAGLLQYAGAHQGLAYPLIAVAVVYGLGQFIESFFLTPRLVGERIGLHPIGVILALLLFGQWAGFVGILVALPVSAVAMIVIRHLLAMYLNSRLYSEGAEGVGHDAARSSEQE